MYSHIPLVLGLALIGAGYKASIDGEHAPFLLLFGITLYVIANRALGYLISHRLLKRHIFFTLSLLPLLIWYLVVRADPLFMIAVLSICLLIYIVLCEVFVRPDIAEGKHIDRRKKPTKWDDA
jgi:low temperature requirement protein LtrA